jgi:hypothetical protein
LNITKIILHALVIFISISINNNSQPALSFENSTYRYLKSNLEFLASAELKGREATTEGEKLAALFISEELEKYGVLPYGDNGSYYQEFDMIIGSFSEESSVSFEYRGSKKSFVNGGEIIFRNGKNINRSRIDFPDNDFCGVEYDIVFVGYGIVSEEDNYDSYKGIDVNKKVVVALSGTPKLDNEEFLSKNAVRNFGRNVDAKIKIAIDKGAAGFIALPSDRTNNNWSFLSRWLTSRSYNLEEEIESNPEENNIPVVLLNEKSSQQLFSSEINDYNMLKDIKDINPKTFNLQTKIRFDYEIIQDVKKSINIIGLIEGYDEDLKNEYVTIGAHYDHEGIRNGEIYYGADDNGSGTVTILEVARKISQSKNNKRPILVIFHAAEEKGLKGSKYLTKNSRFMDSIIVHLNFDMVGRKSEDSIYCIGASKISSELGKLIEDVNSRSSKLVLDYKFDDPNDPQRLYDRSDHYNYAKLGIPIAFFYDNMVVDYTKPTDTVDKINFNKLLRITDLAYNLVLEISNLSEKFYSDNL